MSQNVTSVLISFCNQFSSPNYSLCILNPANGDSRWIDLFALPEGLRQEFSGITGICHAGENIIIATQGAFPALASVSINEAKVTHYIALEKSKDTHSLVFHEGYIYLVSTGTNEIYRVSCHAGQFGKEELFWGYPDAGYEKDEIHLNGLTVDEDGFIASCFGPRKANGSWDAKGRVFYVDSGRTIHGGLSQPHSPFVVADGQLVFAESAARKVYVYVKAEAGGWHIEKELCLDGYTRGITLKDGNLWVGISANRKLSRSQHRLLDNGQGESGGSELVEIDLKTGRQITKLVLLGFGREVYDVVAIPTPPMILPMYDVIGMRIGEIESSMDRCKADLSRFILTSEQLQVAQNHIENLQQSTSWRITAPVRALGELWHRLKSFGQNEKQ